MKPQVVADDVVVSMDYTLTVDNQEMDSSKDSAPIEFIQGYGNIIPGLEKELYGMAPGDSKQVDVSAVEGYGERDPEAVIDVPRSEFPEDIPLRPGIELQMQNMDGDVLTARVISLDDSTVKLDFNHPLAGSDLHFDVTILALRPATSEELEHGHVHGDEEYDEDYDEDNFEDEDDDDFDMDDEEEEEEEDLDGNA